MHILRMVLGALLGFLISCNGLPVTEQPDNDEPESEEISSPDEEPVPVWDLLAEQENAINCAPLDQATAPVSANAIREDRTNVAVLIFDAANHFEAGTILHYPKCLTCSVDSLPVTTVAVQPADFGSISICTRESGAPIFTGTIVWMGRGEINFPISLQKATTFGLKDSAAPPPSDLAILNEGENGSMPEGLWGTASRLAIVHEFQTASHQVMLYRYQPSVGVGNPLEGKWILMFYRP